MLRTMHPVQSTAPSTHLLEVQVSGHPAGQRGHIVGGLEVGRREGTDEEVGRREGTNEVVRAATARLADNASVPPQQCCIRVQMYQAGQRRARQGM